MEKNYQERNKKVKEISARIREENGVENAVKYVDRLFKQGS